MKTQALALATAAFAGCLFALPASACGVSDLVGGRPSQDQLARIEAQAWKTSGALAKLDHASSPRALASGKAIVGLWRFTMISQGNTAMGIPDGVPIDSGYQTWHADGTEIMNSSRAPVTQSFCTGVWDYSGSSYRLNHYALSWDSTGTQFVGPGNIREEVTVDGSGNALSGSFSIDQYAQDGSTVIAHIGGLVEATRITAD